MATSVGPDGIDVPGLGWTSQSTQFNSNKNLESYGAAASSIINPALRQGYSAWTYDPFLAQGTAVAASTTLAALIYIPQSFTCTKLDYIGVANTTNVTGAIWPSTAPAGTATPIAWSAATANTAASSNTLTFNGTNSPLSVVLSGGQFYFVTLYSTTVTVAVLTTPASYITNEAAGSLYSTSTLYRAGTVATLTTVSSTSTFGTSTLSASMPWVGLR